MAATKAMREQVAALERELVAMRAEFVELAPLGGTTARVRFVGRFEGEVVVWDAELIALGTDAPEQFLEIGAAGAAGRAIRVGLRLVSIDRPSVLKTMVMVRNYKRLHLGRHTFGAARGNER